MKNLSTLRVAVTGALGGLGIPTLQYLQSVGAQLIAIDLLNPVAAKKLFADNAITVESYHQVDISDSKAITDLITSLRTKGFPHALVSLAGIVSVGAINEQSEESIRKVFEVNVIGQTLIAQGFIRQWLLSNTSGNIIFTSSWIDHVPWPLVTPYAASKAAIVAMSRGIARELATKNIRSNTISPGIVNIGMAAKQWKEEPSYRQRAQRAIPLGKLQDPLSVAHGIEFLLSDKSSYMTGSNLLIDGGASLYPLDPEEVENR
jgi:NAD(P)-dependent dehydrogenase (short-subunit alcohol dehydrogenase family)